MRKFNFKKISIQTWGGERPFAGLIAIFNVFTFRLRFTIDVNRANPELGFGTVEVWRDGGWEKIHTIRGEHLKTSLRGLPVSASHFDDDFNELARIAGELLEFPSYELRGYWRDDEKPFAMPVGSATEAPAPPPPAPPAISYTPPSQAVAAGQIPPKRVKPPIPIIPVNLPLKKKRPR